MLNIIRNVFIATSALCLFGMPPAAADTVHLPNIHSSSNGFDSAIYVRNDSPVAQNISLSFYNDNGSLRSTAGPYLVAKDGLLYHNPTFTGWSGSVRVTGSYDIASVAMHQQISPDVFASYAAVEAPASTALLPLVQKNNAGISSEIFIHNAGSSSTDLSLQFKASTGTSCTTSVSGLAPKGRKIVKLQNLSCLGSTFVGSVRITNSAGMPLAVSSTQFKKSGSTVISLMEDTAAESAGDVFLPFAQNQNYGWTSGLAAQNASSVASTLTTAFYRPNGTQCSTQGWTLSAYFSAILWPAVPSSNCPAVPSGAVRGGGRDVAATHNVSLGSYDASSHPAVAHPGMEATIPLMLKNWDAWDTGIAVQNVSTASATVTAEYFYSNGQIAAIEIVNLGARGQYVFTSSPIALPTFYGSVKITSNRDIAVSVNHYRESASHDGNMSHIATHR